MNEQSKRHTNKVMTNTKVELKPPHFGTKPAGRARREVPNAGLLTRNRVTMKVKLYIGIFGSNFMNISHRNWTVSIVTRLEFFELIYYPFKIFNDWRMH
jgi:hypothetical protein